MHPSSESLERLVPDELARGDVTGSESLRLHLERYAFAARHARPGRVLDLACGVGYGTRLLAERADGALEAVGVDVAPEAVAYARARYARAGVRFVEADALAFTDPSGFDTVVSLETLEHVADPAALVAHLTSLLRPGGVLVASAPTTPTVDANPHHLHDFTPRSFRHLFDGARLVERDALLQVQRFRPFAVAQRTERRTADLRPDLARWYLRHPRAAAARAWSTLRHGFANHYLTLVWELA